MRVEQDADGFAATATAGNRYMAAKAETLERLKEMALDVVNLIFRIEESLTPLMKSYLNPVSEPTLKKFVTLITYSGFYQKFAA